MLKEAVEDGLSLRRHQLITSSAEGKDFTTSHEDVFIPSCYFDWASCNCAAKISELSSAKQTLSIGIWIRRKQKPEPFGPCWSFSARPTSLFKYLSSGLKCQLDSICSRIFEKRRGRKKYLWTRREQQSQEAMCLSNHK